MLKKYIETYHLFINLLLLLTVIWCSHGKREVGRPRLRWVDKVVKNNRAWCEMLEEYSCGQTTCGIHQNLVIKYMPNIT